MRKFYLSSLLLMLTWLAAPAGWSQGLTANFDAPPHPTCVTPSVCPSFTVNVSGVNFVFTYTTDGDGGSFQHIATGGVGNGASIDVRSASDVPNLGTVEKVTIVRQDGGTFAFSSLFVDVLSGQPVTVEPFLGDASAAPAQTVAVGTERLLTFGGVPATRVQLTSPDFWFTSIDAFSACVTPTVVLTKGLSCPGQPTQFLATTTNVSPEAQYLWDFNNDNVTDATTTTNAASHVYPGPGSYTAKVTVVQGTCQNAATIPVNIVPLSTAVLTGGGTICAADSATLSIALTGTGPWTVAYSNGPTTFITSGVETSPYVFKVKPLVNRTYTMLNVADVNNCPGTASGSAVVTLGTPPSISGVNVTRGVCAGGPLTLNAIATGTDLTYQWQKGGIAIPGATNSTFSIPETTLEDSGVYTVQVSGACGSPVTSNLIPISYPVPLAITSQPAPVAICAGGNTSFSVGADNANSYQWQVNTGAGFADVTNNAIYSGATTGTLDITGATADMNGYQYRAVVSGSCPSQVSSNAATLTVNSPASISGVNVRRGVCAGGPLTLNAIATGTDLTYQWQKGGIAIPGATNSTFSIPETTLEDSGVYTVQVSGACGSPVTSNLIPISYPVPPAITSQPAPVAICAGSNTSFSVGADNANSYQWQVNTGTGFVNLTNGVLYSGVNTATLLITGATAALNGYEYRAVVGGSCPPAATSAAAKLTVGTPTTLGSFTPLVAPVLIGTRVTMTIAFTGDAPAAATWNWGDGTTSNAMVVGNTLTGSHVYAAQNVYSPSITVTSCGATATQSYEYVVVYDPNGGFMTGGGWFNSPAGAYRPQPSLEGRVNFGFVSKYKRGTTVPDGNTQFQYRMGNLNFHSTAYEWLVISGAKGQYRGSGTINGTGNYGFILTATDGGKRPDRLRMKIWNKANNAVVYDNQFGASDTADPTTVITGGSILIKAPSKSAREGVAGTETVSLSGTALRAYPNPFTGEVVVDLSDFAPGRVRLDITDQQGRPVHRQEVQVGEQTQSVRLDLAGVKSGLYLLQAKGRDGQKWIKLIKR